MKKTILLFFVSFLIATESQAMHLGGFLGPSYFSSNFPGKSGSFSLTTGGFDAAIELTPALEFGLFYLHTSGNYQTLIGTEAFVYPLLEHDIYGGVKLANANLPDGNHLAYGPAVGFNYDLIAKFLSVGLDATYYFYSISSTHNLSVLACAKLWL